MAFADCLVAYRSVSVEGARRLAAVSNILQFQFFSVTLEGRGGFMPNPLHHVKDGVAVAEPLCNRRGTKLVIIHAARDASQFRNSLRDTNEVGINAAARTGEN